MREVYGFQRVKAYTGELLRLSVHPEGRGEAAFLPFVKGAQEV